LFIPLILNNYQSDENTFQCSYSKDEPDLTSIICTGYSEVASLKSAAALGVLAVVQKPIVKGALARALREGLDRRA